MSALDNKQKQYLAQLAERAYNLAAAKLRGEGAELRLAGVTAATAPDRQTALECLALLGTAQARGEWRHAHVAQAVAKEGLRCCDQLDYKNVEGHFLDLIKRPDAAFRAYVRAGSEEKRQAEYKLQEACEKWGFDLAYAGWLAKTIHKTTLYNASVSVIWKLIYTVNNRGKAKRDREAREKQELMNSGKELV